MGKRSDFDRVEKDFYRTIDSRAVDALAPHLNEETIYAEPCYGQGDLVFQLARHGHSCGWASDITHSNVGYTRDALTLTEEDLEAVNVIITNPPWSRLLLHGIIEHLSALKPTWLLFDADWAHTKQSAPYIKHCRTIVSVGRLIWIPGTTMTGKDNCAWYLFDQKSSGPTQFVGR